MNEHLPGRACQFYPCCKPPSQLKDRRHEQPSSPWEPCPGSASLPEYLGRCLQGRENSSLARDCTTCAVTAPDNPHSSQQAPHPSEQHPGAPWPPQDRPSLGFSSEQGEGPAPPLGQAGTAWVSSTGSERVSRALNPAAPCVHHLPPVHRWELPEAQAIRPVGLSQPHVLGSCLTSWAPQPCAVCGCVSSLTSCMVPHCCCCSLASHSIQWHCTVLGAADKQTCGQPHGTIPVMGRTHLTEHPNPCYCLGSGSDEREQLELIYPVSICSQISGVLGPCSGMLS